MDFPEDEQGDFNFLLDGEGRLGARTARSAGNFDAIYGADVRATGAADGADDEAGGAVDEDGGYSDSDEDDDVEIILEPVSFGVMGIETSALVTAAAARQGGAAGGGAGDDPTGPAKWNKYVRGGADGDASAQPDGTAADAALANNILAHVPGGIQSLRQPTDLAIEIDLDSLPSHPWREAGADITEYFNYGFTEESWRAYCRRQFEIRFEKTGAAPPAHIELLAANADGAGAPADSNGEGAPAPERAHERGRGGGKGGRSGAGPRPPTSQPPISGARTRARAQLGAG